MNSNCVKIGFIGLGQRGLATLRRYMLHDHIRVTALCDLSTAALDAAEAILTQAAKPLAARCSDWRECLRRDDFDMVYICTDWLSHAEIALEAMHAAKDVAVEVPAAVTVNDCHRLVETAEATGRRLAMMENCCFDPFALTSLNISREGLLGELYHCEGAYIHDLRKRFNGSWYGSETSANAGNPYPTHGLGPMCQLLDINRSDRIVELSSMTGRARGCTSGVNSTLLRTAHGRTMLLQFDVTTPRPYNRLQTACGTRGYISKYPLEMLQLEGADSPLTGDELKQFLDQHAHPYISAYRPDAERLGADNLMNYIMDRRLIECMRSGEPFDISPADAALWSSIAELSNRSASLGGRAVEVPEF